MSKQHKPAPGQTAARTFGCQARTVGEGDSRTVELSFSSEQPYERWFGPEILCHDEGAVRMERLSEVGTLLFHHGMDPGFGSLPLGSIKRLWIEGNRGMAEVEFDRDEQSDLIFQKVKSGSLKGVSVRYNYLNIEEVKEGSTSTNGRFEGPCYVATRWEPLEISIEPIPADPSVGVGREHKESEEKRMDFIPTNTPGQEPETPEQAQRQAAPAPAPPAVQVETPPTINVEEIRSQERTRTTEIYALCREFGMDAQPFLEGEETVDQVRQTILNEVRTNGFTPLTANVHVTADEEDKFRLAARDGQLLRTGYVQVEKPAAGSGDFRNLSLRELAVQCLQRSGDGVNYAVMNDRDLYDSVMRTGATPSNAFLSIVNDSIGASLSQGYQLAPSTFERWTGKGSNPNFKKSKHFRLSAAGTYKLIPEGGEFQATSMIDQGVDTQLNTYGVKFAFTRETFINDDLGTLVKVIGAQGRAGRMTINTKVYEVLTGNTQVGGKALFHGDHKNLGTAAGLGIDSLTQMMTMIRLQKDISGKQTLNLMPRFLLVPVALAVPAAVLLGSGGNPEGDHAGVKNPLYNLFETISDPNLDEKSPKTYYLAADPGSVDTIQVTYLNGQESPILESHPAWNTLGMEYRVYHDFTVDCLDFRGLAKNEGK